MALPLLFDRGFKPTGVANDRAAIEYNGFKFPTAIKTSAQIVPVLDDSGRMLKYNELNLRVSFYIFHGLNLGTDGTADNPNEANNFYSGSYDYLANVPSGITELSPSADGVKDANFTTDQEMDFLKKRLMEPGQHLKVTSQGLGVININDPEDTTTNDVDNGPKPRLAAWRPLGNKCCYVEWFVIVRYSPCAQGESSEEAIAQFPFTVTHHINRRGLTTRTITGKVEFAMSRVPTDDAAHAGIAKEFTFGNYQGYITRTFPMLTGFYREQNYTLADDRKNVSFTIVDEEIDSDEAFGEGCIREDIKLTTSNTHPRVFNNWNVSLSGTIELAAGYPKSYALAEISRLFTRYFVVCGALASNIRHTGGTVQERSEGEGYTGTNPDQSNVTVSDGLTHILENISLTDNLFGRTISFSISWSLITSIQTLFKATGMFIPARYYPVDSSGVPIPGDMVEAPGDAQREQWLLWKTSLGIFLDYGGFQALDFNQNDDVIVSLCQPLTGGGQEVPELNIQYDPHIEELGTPEVSAGNAWIDYQPQFAITRTEHTTEHQPLGTYAGSQETALAPDTSIAATEFSAKAPLVPDSSQQIHVHNQREPEYHITFSGYAIRINYPVPEPSLQQYGGKVAYPVGESQILPQFIGNGVDLVTGKSYKIYGLRWSKTYALLSPPAGAKIISDGHKDIYT